MGKPVATLPGVRYTGDGTAWVPGVPMRDLLPEEWLKLTDEQRAICLATQLYVLVGVLPKEDDHGRERIEPA